MATYALSLLSFGIMLLNLSENRSLLLASGHHQVGQRLNSPMGEKFGRTQELYLVRASKKWRLALPGKKYRLRPLRIFFLLNSKPI
jgi:hypothetical protein